MMPSCTALLTLVLGVSSITFPPSKGSDLATQQARHGQVESYPQPTKLSQPLKTYRPSKQTTRTYRTPTFRVDRATMPVDHPNIEGVEATLSWDNMVKGNRLGSSFVLKQGEKFVEYAVLYQPRDSSFVVRNLLDATGYMGELRVLRNKEALSKINSTNVKDTIIFKLDTPRIISESETDLVLSVLTNLPPSSVKLDSVSIGFNIPKQKEDAILEVADLSKEGSGAAMVHVVPNTVTVVVNDLPAQTVVRVLMKSANPSRSAKTLSTMFVFTGSVTNIAEKVPQVSATATRVGLLSNVQRRPTVTCYVKNKPPFQGFPCHDSNVCVPLHWECDGEEDCDGGYDENGCQGGLSSYTRQYINSQNGNTLQTGRCKQGEFECLRRGVNVCLPVSWLCDGRVDCANGWDENQSNCNGYGFPTGGNNYHLSYNPNQCGRNQYKCRKGGCVSLRSVCDGQRDCRDGSDEDDCPEDEGTDIDEDVYHGDSNCDPDHEYVCSGLRKKCVPRPWVCDDEDDCPGGEDESDDLCNNHFHNFND